MSGWDMSGWGWPDPFQVLPMGLLPIPTDYHFLFNPIPPVGVVIGVFLIFGRRKRPAKSLMPLFALLLAAMGGAIVVGQKYTLDYEPGIGCPRSGEEHYVTVKPLFVPERVRMLMPDRGQFDAITCNQYAEEMMEHAMPGWVATLGLLAVLIAIASVSLGAIFAWPSKFLPKPMSEAAS